MKLKVFGKNEFNGNLFYEVEYEKKRYNVKLYGYQETLPLPEEIDCYIKQVNGRTIIAQDFVPYLRQKYKSGRSYQFYVRNDFSHSGYYEVSDENGFFFHIDVPKNIKLYIGQEITCEVKSLQGVNARLELVNSDDTQIAQEEIETAQTQASQEQMQRYILEGALNGEQPGWDVVKLTELIFCNEEPYAAYVNQWVSEKIELMKADGITTELLQQLEEMQQAVLFILEETDYLNSFAPQQRKVFQQRLSCIGLLLRGYIKSVKLIIKGKHEDTINHLLNKLNISGYIFQASEQLELMRCLFSVNREMMANKMQDIFDIIHRKDESLWQNEPFRTAFIGLLELFIGESKRQVDATTSHDTKYVRMILEALAIQLHLADPQKDKAVLDYNLNRAMLYRYATYLKTSIPQNALYNAYHTLMDICPEEKTYTWRDTSLHDLIASKLSVNVVKEENGEARKSYQDNGIRLIAEDGKITIQPMHPTGKLHPILPSEMLKWNNMQVELDADIKLPSLNLKKNKDLKVFQNLWKEIESELSTTKEPEKDKDKTKKKKHHPTSGEIYGIRILYLDEYDRYVCRIVDDEVEGDGYLTLADFVPYNVKPQTEAFRGDNGEDLVFEAKVINIDNNDMCHFTANKLIHQFMTEEVISYNDMQPCLVTNRNEKGLIGVSHYGVSVSLRNHQDYPDLKAGDIVMANWWEKDKAYHVSAEILSVSDKEEDFFSTEDAFKNLMSHYAIDTYGEPDNEYQTQVIQQENILDKARIGEIMNLIDRVAVQETDYMVSYNYLGMARLIARMTDDQQRYTFYTGWMKLISLLHYFAMNGIVPTADLQEFESSNAHLFDVRSEIHKRYIQLKIISYKGKDDHRKELWDMTMSDDEDISKLAENVLAYNLLGERGYPNSQQEIEEKIQSLLKIKNHENKLKDFGEEDLHHEFKTSIVYPSDNGMRADLAKQTGEILKEVCAMLNTQGGTLYIGVNDYGLGVGMNNDLDYAEFKGSKDKYDLHVRNQICIALGKDADAYVNGTFEKHAGRDIYILTIKPYPRPLEYNGVIYERHGTSKISLTGEDARLFRERRLKEMATTTQPEATETKPTKETPAVEKQENTKTNGTGNVVFLEDKIATSVRRNPAPLSWESNYGIIGYLQFIQNKFRVMDDYYGQDEEQGVFLTLSIHEEDEDKYLILAYEDGNICKIPITNIIEKQRGKEYARRSDSKLLFAEIAAENNALMSISKNRKGGMNIRLDTVESLQEEDNLNGLGDKMMNVEVDSYTRFDILSPMEKLEFKDLVNRSKKDAGKPFFEERTDKTYKRLKELGLF